MEDSPSTSPRPNDGGGSIFGPVHITRALIIIMIVLFAIAFHYAARWIGWPAEYHHRGSLAQPPVAIVGLLVAIALLVICTAVGTLVLGRRWFLGGLLCATAGLTVWSARGGTITPVLFNAQNSGANQAVFIQMLIELIVFFGVIGALWNVIWTRWSRPFKAPKPVAESDEAARSTGAALLAQVAIMAIIVLLFNVTPLKKQVLTSVFFAGVIATGVAEYFFATRQTGRWYWIAPLIVGVIGYLAGFFSPAGLATGDLQGALAPLARALPLDYASLGAAGVLVGYWWMEPEAVTDPAPNLEPTPPSPPAAPVQPSAA